MCRMAAWCGAPRPLSLLLYDTPHGLERQAYAPRSMLSGHVNVDGTGVVWWPRAGDAPLRYATERPPWSDVNLQRLAPRLEAATILALVRSATPGQALGEAAVGPFEMDGLALAHNGFVEPWHGRARRPLLEALDDDLYQRAEPGTDSQVYFLHALQIWRRDPVAGVAAALSEAAERVGALVERAGGRARLDAVLSDGTSVAALRHAVGLEPNSLVVARRGDGTFFASEPLDAADDWEPLAPREVVEAALPPDQPSPTPSDRRRTR